MSQHGANDQAHEGEQHASGSMGCQNRFVRPGHQPDHHFQQPGERVDHGLQA
ncbi:hypothetical protein VRB51_16785 [Pseudomonas trivialis]